MDEMELETAHDINSDGYNAEAEAAANESGEDEFNPLGLLDLVYVEEEERKNSVSYDDNATASTSNISFMQNQNCSSSDDDDDDDDEGDELEPLATVDVLPGREEDFFPEGLYQEVEPGGDTWTTARESNADNVHHQRSLQEYQLVGAEDTLQYSMVQFPEWIEQNQLMSLQSAQFPFSYQQWNIQENDLANIRHLHSLSHKLPEQQEQHALSRRQYYQRYRQKNPELVRIRNREYARRYRQAHADRVRERQRAYIKKYRERKRLLQDQAAFLVAENEQHDIIATSERNGSATVLSLNGDGAKKETIVQREQERIFALKSKPPETVVVKTTEPSEIVVLS